MVRPVDPSRTSYTVNTGCLTNPPTTTTPGVKPMTERTCDCPKCSCKLGEHPIVRHGKHYCCEACAKHHEHGEECVNQGCKCAH